MRILITGGAGFIGCHLARLLTADGHALSALDSLHPQVHRDRAAAAAFPGPVHEGDVADPAAWESLAAHEAIVHLAAETGTGQSMYQREHYRRVNVEGTRLAARTAAAWEAPIVSLSSRAVYGEGRTECPEHGASFGTRCCERAVPAASREDDPHRPVSVYGETKSQAEQALQEETAGRVPSAIIRPQNVIGPGQALHNPYTGVLAAFLARLREGRALTVYGDGLQTRDMVHVQDVARVIAWALARSTSAGMSGPSGSQPEPLVVNAGTGERVTLLDLARFAIAGSPRTDVSIEHLDVHRAGDIQDACADLTRLRSLGGPLPQVAPADAVAAFIRASWEQPGADSSAWDGALEELRERGMTR